jgi:hypothetical protein
MDSHTVDSHMLDPHQLEGDPHADAPGAAGPTGESANLRAMKEVFRAVAEGGIRAGVDALLRISHEDCRFRPASAEGRVLEGHDEVRTFFGAAEATGTSISVRPRLFEEHGDEIVVSGSMRVMQPEGSFAERQIRWIYRFRDGLVEEACWGPRHSD